MANHLPAPGLAGCISWVCVCAFSRRERRWCQVASWMRTIAHTVQSTQREHQKLGCSQLETQRGLGKSKRLGPGAKCPFSPLLLGGRKSPCLKIDYRKKIGYPYSNLSNLEDLDALRKLFLQAMADGDQNSPYRTSLNHLRVLGGGCNRCRCSFNRIYVYVSG